MIPLQLALLALGASALPISKEEKAFSYDQDHLFPFLGGAAPYFSFPTPFGISTDTPDTCTVEQIQLLSRHGERYPTVSKGKALTTLYEKFTNYTGEFSGNLSFLNDYTFFVDKSQLEKETTTNNTVLGNPYLGETNLINHGRYFYTKYSDLLNNETLPVFTSNSKRVYDSAVNFARGFNSQHMLKNKNPIDYSVQIISENATTGANTLTPIKSCSKFDEDESEEYVKAFPKDYLKQAAERINDSNPGLNITTSDVQTMYVWCAFEINVRGRSDMCDVLTMQELINFSYYDDLTEFYEHGPGNSLGKTVGSVLFNASLQLLTEENPSNKIWLSFTHDTDISNFLAAVGLFDTGKNMTSKHPEFQGHVFHKSWFVPQGARVYTEKLSCNDTSYVRYVVNDAVIPINGCSSGPGLSCELNDFVEYANGRIGDLDYVQSCEIKENTTLTFYWDYKDKQYSAIPSAKF